MKNTKIHFFILMSIFLTHTFASPRDETKSYDHTLKASATTMLKVLRDSDASYERYTDWIAKFLGITYYHPARINLLEEMIKSPQSLAESVRSLPSLALIGSEGNSIIDKESIEKYFEATNEQSLYKYIIEEVAKLNKISFNDLTKNTPAPISYAEILYGLSSHTFLNNSLVEAKKQRLLAQNSEPEIKKILGAKVSVRENNVIAITVSAEFFIDKNNSQEANFITSTVLYHLEKAKISFEHSYVSHGGELSKKWATLEFGPDSKSAVKMFGKTATRRKSGAIRRLIGYGSKS